MNRIILAALVAALGAACSDTPASPTGNDSSLVFGALTPGSGATLITTGATPGAFITRESEQLWIPITIRFESNESTARLFVYLKDQNGISCGQNVPDAPDFGPLEDDTVQTYTVRAFQVFRLPCEVASIRAVLHRRVSRNLNTEILPGELIAEHSMPVRYSVR